MEKPAEYQRRRSEAEAEAQAIVEQARHEAAAFTEEAQARIAELVTEAGGLPDGVVNVVTGFGDPVDRYRVESLWKIITTAASGGDLPLRDHISRTLRLAGPVDLLYTRQGAPGTALWPIA